MSSFVDLRRETMRGSQRSQCSVVQKAVLRRGQCLSGEGAQCVEFPGDCRRRVGVHAARKPLNHAGLLRYGLQKRFGFDILPSLSLRLPRVARKERGFLRRSGTASSHSLSRFGGFLLLAALLHRSLHRRTGRVPPLKH